MSNIPRCEHPRPDRHRESWINLNGTWDFEIDNAKVGLFKNFQDRDSLDGKITVACGRGRIDLLTVVPEGKSKMSSADFIRGRKIALGDILK